MRVIYNGVELVMCEVNAYEFEPFMDDTGHDVLYHNITIAVTTVINAYNTATNKGAGGTNGGYGVAGDRLGISLDNLKDLLCQPRQTLKVYAGNDLVLQVPDTVSGGTLPCDPAGGPYPGKAVVHQISGDQSAVLTWRIKVAVSPCTNYLLSNRWVPSVHIDGEGFSTRVIDGTAVFRKDYLAKGNLTADSFRQWLIVPCSSTMQRISVEVDERDDGAVLNYRVTDKEVAYGLGGLAGITRIEGNVTFGAESPIRTHAEAVVAKVKSFAWNAVIPSGRTRADTPDVGTIMTTCGTTKANGICRVFAQRGTDKGSMVKVAINFLQDRLAATGIGVFGSTNTSIVSMYLTQDISSGAPPFIELRMEFLLFSVNAIKALFDPSQVPNNMNLSNTYMDKNKTIIASPTTTAQQMPNSSNTRGSWIGALAIAALKQTLCDLPGAPTDPGTVLDESKLA